MSEKKVNEKNISVTHYFTLSANAKAQTAPKKQFPVGAQCKSVMSELTDLHCAPTGNCFFGAVCAFAFADKSKIMSNGNIFFIAFSPTFLFRCLKVFIRLSRSPTAKAKNIITPKIVSS